MKAPIHSFAFDRLHRPLAAVFAWTIQTTTLLVMAAPMASGAWRYDREHTVSYRSVRVTEEPVLVLRDLRNVADPRDSISSRIRSETSFTESGAVLWIARHSSATDLRPRMPQIEAFLEEIPPQLRVRWRFECVYDRPDVPSLVAEDTVQYPVDSQFVELPADKPWKLYELYKQAPFFGGNATIHFEIVAKDNTVVLPEKKYRFRIAGQNPSYDGCRKYIDQCAERLAQSSHQPRLWFAYAIAKHETKDEGGTPYYNQFLLDGGSTRKNTYPEKGIPNHYHDRKRRGVQPPGGYGIFQVTGYRGKTMGQVPREIIWNWQRNIDEGMRELLQKQKDCIAWMIKQKRMMLEPIPDLTIFEWTFKEGSPRTMTDLVTMKYYNGASPSPDPDPDPEPDPKHFFYTGEVATCGHYFYFNGQKACLSRYNCDRFNYVKRVCLEIEK